MPLLLAVHLCSKGEGAGMWWDSISLGRVREKGEGIERGEKERKGGKRRRREHLVLLGAVGGTKDASAPCRPSLFQGRGSGYVVGLSEPGEGEGWKRERGRKRQQEAQGAEGRGGGR
jgi:hypothetical protein